MFMKTTAIFLTGAFTVLPLCLSLAADPEPSSSDTAPQIVPAPAPAPVISGPPPVTVSAPAKLPYGVDDVLKLSHAQISDDIILHYIQGSGTIYNLTPKEIVYLRDQGVSEKVITAMLNQRKQVEMAAQNAPAPVTQIQNAPTVADAPSVADAGVAQQAPTYTEGAVTAPLTPPASSAYVIPYGGSYYAPYTYYDPYWYGGWYGPSVVFGFGGRGFFGHHFHGGHGGSFAHGGGGHGGHR